MLGGDGCNGSYVGVEVGVMVWRWCDGGESCRVEMGVMVGVMLGGCDGGELCWVGVMVGSYVGWV